MSDIEVFKCNECSDSGFDRGCYCGCKEGRDARERDQDDGYGEPKEYWATERAYARHVYAEKERLENIRNIKSPWVLMGAGVLYTGMGVFISAALYCIGQLIAAAAQQPVASLALFGQPFIYLAVGWVVSRFFPNWFIEDK